MNERRDDLQELIDKALKEMTAEAGEDFDPPGMQPVRLLPQDRPDEVEGRNHQGPRLQALPHGNSGRKAGTTALTGHTGPMDDLLGKGVTNSQVIYERLGSQGYRGGLTSVKVYVAAHMDLVPRGEGRSRRGAVGSASRPARRGIPDGLGLRHGRRPGRRRAQARVLCDGVPPPRQPLRRVLPQRTSGELAHRNGPRLRGPGVPDGGSRAT